MRSWNHWFDIGFPGDSQYDGKTVFRGKSYELVRETWINFVGKSAACGAALAP